MMHRYIVSITLSVVLLFPHSAQAWNNYGHMTVAYVAYQGLTPQTRTKVNSLLAENPDFPNWVAMLPARTPAGDTNVMLFMIAATWADRIKHSADYREDDPTDRNKSGGAMSFQNTGFSDHLRHRPWHSIDVAFSQDGTTNLPATSFPNAQERVDLFRPVLGGNNDDLKAYDLSWLLHLVGDLHQPLHCVTRVEQARPDGDAGGSLVEIKLDTSTVKLRAFWNDILGPTSASPTAVIKTAKKLPSSDPAKANDLNISHWVDEGIQNASTAVYVAPVGPGPGPFTMTSKYQKAAKTLAKKQVALAGARLANLLNAELK